MKVLKVLSCCAILVLAGCAANGAKNEGEAPAPKPAVQGPPAGMNSRGEVVDSSKVEAGSGQKVKGLNDWEGEITGKPAKNSKFVQLKIGMPMRQVSSIAGTPSDEGGYMTGKSFIPFYYGADRHRYEMVFKGQGRLIFAGGSIGDYAGWYLVWIIHNANEPGKR